MSDIKLKPDCELEEALKRFHYACVDEARNVITYQEWEEARAHLLEVIREGNEQSAKHGDEEDCREPGVYRAIANEIMGVV